ncbi:MAG: antibiotic biosynthesis monooxygenase family protein [Chloroflexia bacterium]
MLVAIIRVPAPPDREAAAAMEKQFAERLPMVSGAAGFLGFELLRPVEGGDTYLSISRWTNKKDFEAWRAGASNAQAHSRPAGSAPPQRGGAELYEVAV